VRKLGLHSGKSESVDLQAEPGLRTPHPTERSSSNRHDQAAGTPPHHQPTPSSAPISSAASSTIPRNRSVNSILEPFKQATDQLARLEVRYPEVHVVFADSRGFADEWTHRFLSSALADALGPTPNEQLRRIQVDQHRPSVLAGANRDFRPLHGSRQPLPDV